MVFSGIPVLSGVVVFRLAFMLVFLAGSDRGKRQSVTVGTVCFLLCCYPGVMCCSDMMLRRSESLASGIK